MKLTHPIAGIFLDIGWTMLAPASGEWMLTPEFYAQVGRERIAAVPAPRWAAANAACMRFLDENHLVKTEQAEYEQFSVFYRLLGEQLPELGLSGEAIASLAYDKVYNDANYLFYDDVKPALLALKQSYKLGIISDTWPSAKRVLQNAGIYDLFDAVTFSCNLGVYKPHARMYEHALSALGVPPEQTVFVDDAPACLEGAEAHGVQPVLITRAGRTATHGRFACVQDFCGLTTLLKA